MRTSVLESNSSRGDDRTTPRLAGIEQIVEIKLTADGTGCAEQERGMR